MSRQYTNLEVELVGHTAVVTLANPPANTWTTAGLTALAQLVGELNANREVYSLVVIGQGEKFFSAGADLNVFADGDKTVARDMVRRFEGVNAFLEKRAPKWSNA
jgi:enoyl-CoA hydratase/carnithine racemase